MRPSAYPQFAPDEIAIPLHERGVGVIAFTIINRCDERQAFWLWHRTYFGYARRIGPRDGGEGARIWLHREILQPPDGMQVDHIDGNRLNNRRSNLRLATVAQNAQNQQPRGGASQFRGVTYCTQTGRWKARVRLDGVEHWLGRFIDEDEAATAARDFRRAHMSHANEET